MAGRATRHSARGQDDPESHEPLLQEESSRHNVEDRILFAVPGDNEDEDDGTVTIRGDMDYDANDIYHALGGRHEAVVPPVLKSTIHSRETEFDLDDDILDEHMDVPLTPYESRMPNGHSTLPPSRRRETREQAMPLLVGLLDASALRSPETPNGYANADLEELVAKSKAGGGMLDSIANMANSILGAGIIGLPYAISEAGFVTGLVLLVTLCAVTDWTIRLIVVNAKLSGRNSYIDIMDHCFGPSGRAAVSVFQFAFAFGGMCAFGIIIGDTIPHVIRSIFPTLQSKPFIGLLANRQFVVVLCTACVSYPLSLYRDIAKLSRASGLALVGMLIIVSSVLFEGSRVAPELRGPSSERFTIIRPRVFEAIGVISFAYVCHHNSLLIYGSLRTPTLDRFAKVTHASTLLSLVACLTLAVSAYLVFTVKTQGNILNNFAPNDTVINLARFCFGLNMFTTLPLELFVCREVIEQYFFSHETFNMQRHLLFTTSILFASMFIALITCDLGVALEITGGVSATALAYIFPAACYLRLLPRSTPLMSRTKLPAALCAVFGAVVMVLSLGLAMRKTWTREGDARICN